MTIAIFVDQGGHVLRSGSLLGLCVSLIFVTNLSQALQGTAAKPQGSREIRVMSYNVENLFDVEHDHDKNDWEFLPSNYPGKESGCRQIAIEKYQERCMAIDWTAEKLELKLQQIKKAINITSPILPDILGVSEVENEKVVGRLAQTLGYKEFVMTDSPDERGIDVALLYNPSRQLVFVNFVEHAVSPKLTGKASRNVLQANFTVGGQPLAVFMNHWPSQAADSSTRVNVAKFVMEQVKAVVASNPRTTVLVMGDFNVTDKDRPDPFFDVLENPKAGAAQLIDIDSKWRKQTKEAFDYAKLNAFPLGTYFFAPELTFNVLDRFFVSQNAFDKSGLEVKLESYQIAQAPELSKKHFYNGKHSLAGSVVQNVPMRYFHNASDPAKAGFSDHFPIIIDLFW